MSADPDPAAINPGAEWLRWLPGLRMIRLASVALSARMLLLGALLTASLWVGWWAIDRGLAPAPGAELAPIASWSTDPPRWPRPERPETWRHAWDRLTWPAQAAIRPFALVFSPSQSSWHALAGALWTLTTIAFVGTAMARIAAVAAATGGRVGLRASLGFAARHGGMSLLALLTPFLGVALFALPLAALGLLTRIEHVAADVVAAALVLPGLLAGVMMALLMIGLAVGWPLMITTVAAEREDAFEAVSRAYSYAIHRPLSAALLAVAALPLMALGLLTLDAVTAAAWQCTHAAAAWGAGTPDPFGDAGPGAARIVAAGGSALQLILKGGAWALFWSAVTYVYLTLRLLVDGARWGEVAPVDRTPDQFAATT